MDVLSYDSGLWKFVLFIAIFPLIFGLLFILAFILELFGLGRPTTSTTNPKPQPKPSKQPLETKIVPGDKLDEVTIEEVFALFNFFFTNEFADADQFQDFLRSGRDVILFRDPNISDLDIPCDRIRDRPILVGFTILRTVLDRQVPFDPPPPPPSSPSLIRRPKPKKLVSSEDNTKHEPQYQFISITNEFFGLHRDYRSLSTPLLSLVKYCMWTKLLHPFTPVYYFFITYSYKSYLAFGRTLGHYYPKHSMPVPPRERQILQLLGTEAAGDWGVYNPKTYVIHDKSLDLTTAGRLRFELSEPREMTETIKYFLEDTEADYTNGDCLCVVSILSWSSIWYGFKKAWTRFRNKPLKRRDIVADSSSGSLELQSSDESSGSVKSADSSMGRLRLKHKLDQLHDDKMKLSEVDKMTTEEGAGGEVRQRGITSPGSRGHVAKISDQTSTSTLLTPDTAKLRKMVGSVVFNLAKAYVAQNVRKTSIVDSKVIELSSRTFTARILEKRKQISQLHRMEISGYWTSLSKAAEPDIGSNSAYPSLSPKPPPTPTGPLKKLLKHVAVGARRKSKPISQSQDDHVSPQHLSHHLYERKKKSLLLCSLTCLDESASECTSILRQTIDTSTPVTTQGDSPSSTAFNWLDALENEGPTASNFIKEVVSYWLSNKFDWPMIRAELDASVPQYITSVGGRQIHYLHLKSQLIGSQLKQTLAKAHHRSTLSSDFASSKETSQSTTLSSSSPEYPENFSPIHSFASSFGAVASQDLPEVSFVPLLLLHGDCSTPFELIPLFSDLVTPSLAMAFHVVAPSMPGCGLSSPPQTTASSLAPSSSETTEPLKQSGRNPAAVFDHSTFPADKSNDILYENDPITTSATLLAHLMIHTLGYHRFAVATLGEYSTKLGSIIAAEYPDNCIALHTSHLPSSLNSDSFRQQVLAKCRMNLKKWIFPADQQRTIQRFSLAERLQAKLEIITPELRTVESITAFLLQTYRNQCLSEESLWYWPVKTIIANIIIYWATGSLPRTYQLLHMAKSKSLVTVPVPVAYTAFPGDVSAIPRELGQVDSWIKFKRSVRSPTGGPFPTFEVPSFLSAEIRAFLRACCREPSDDDYS